MTPKCAGRRSAARRWSAVGQPGHAPWTGTCPVVMGRAVPTCPGERDLVSRRRLNVGIAAVPPAGCRARAGRTRRARVGPALAEYERLAIALTRSMTACRLPVLWLSPVWDPAFSRALWRGDSGGGYARSAGGFGGGLAVGDAEFGQDAGEVVAYGHRAEHELAGDSIVVQSAGDQAEYLPFPGG